MINADQEMSLSLTAAELNVMFGALGEIPYRVAQPIVDKLRQQILSIDATAFDTPATTAPPAHANGAASPL